MIFIATLKNSKAKAKKINNLEVKAPNSRNNTVNIKKVNNLKFDELKTNVHIHGIKKETKKFYKKKSFYITILLGIWSLIMLIFHDENLYVNLLISLFSFCFSYIIDLIE